MIVYNKETNSYPYVFHANGNSKNQDITIWNPLLRFIESGNFSKSKMDNQLSVVTIKGGRYEEVITPLEKCCKNFGIDPIVLKWPNTKDFWEGTKAKHYEVIKAIDSKIISTKYMIFLDCSDILFLKHPNNILNDFLSFYPDKYSLWNGERNDWPRFDLPKYVHHPVLDEYILKVSQRDRAIKEKEKTSFVFLNSGAVIGLTDRLYDFFVEGYNSLGKVRTVDQAIARVTQYKNDNHQIDIHCNIFQCLYATDMSIFEVKNE